LAARKPLPLELRGQGAVGMNGAGTAPPKRTRIAPVDTDPDHDELSTRSEPHVGICRQNSMLRKAVLRVQMKKSRTEPVNSFSAAVKAAQVASQASQSFTNAKPHSSHIVDCNRKFCAVARLLTVKKARKRSRKYSVAAPAAWMGAAKLDRNVGDTVVSVAVSDDDR
jgi:aspartate oxidase